MAQEWRRIFNIGLVSAIRPGTRAAPHAPHQQGAFVTPQSISSFAGASFVVGLLWKSSGYLEPSWSQSNLAGLLISAAVALFLFLVSVTDPARTKPSPRDWLIEGVVALINGLVLFSAALGGKTALVA